MLTVLYAGRADQWAAYDPALNQAVKDAGLAARIVTEAAPADVDYIVYAPNGGLTDFSPYTNVKGVLNLWAGVETIVGNQTLTQPLVRMSDSGLVEGMVEWVVGHVLRHHLGFDKHIVNPDRHWDLQEPPLARDRSVTILGLGALGTAAAKALSALNFNVTGWSRSPKSVPGVTSFAGEDGLDDALRPAEILVLLLPDTPETEHILNAERLRRMPRGAVIINPGRGPLIDDDALLAALDDGQISHATLDVFRVEPLPQDHPYWAHPSVTVTPHIASTTRVGTAAAYIAQNIRLNQEGAPYLNLVDRSAGY